MKSQTHLDESPSDDQVVMPTCLVEAVKVWYRKYQELDDLSAKLDAMAGEINHLRYLVEQKMKDLDRLFTPPCE